MFGNADETRKSYEKLLSFLFRVFLDKAPSDEDLAELFRRNYELRRQIALELLHRDPSLEILTMIVEDIRDPDVRADAWKLLKRGAPPESLLVEMMKSHRDLADDAAAALLSNPRASVTALSEIIRQVKPRAEEAADRILAAAATTTRIADEGTEGLKTVIRCVPSRSEAAWERLLSAVPSEMDLAGLLDFNEAFARRVRAELLRRFPDNPKQRRLPYGMGNDMSAEVAEHVVNHAASTKDELLWVVRYEPGHADAAWRKYLALGPADEELTRVMMDIPHVRGRAWRVLRKRGISNQNLCLLLWNLHGMNGRAIWRQLLKQSPSRAQLRGLVSGTPLGLEAARLLLEHEPDWDDYRAVINGAPSLREELFLRLSGTSVPDKRALLWWMRDIEERLRDL